MRGGQKWQTAIQVLALALFVAALALGVGRATRKWRHNRSEWCYWRMFVEQPMHEVFGAEKPLYGYLPGAKALFIPFVATGVAGFLAFAVVNAGSCVGIVMLLARRMRLGDGTRSPLAIAWLLLCCSVPSYFAIQNNQVVAPAVFLSLLAFTFLERKHPVLAGCVLAAAALVKTVPVALFLLPLLLRSWLTSLVAVLALIFLSLGLSAATEGVADSVRYHVGWPAQVLAQDPTVSKDEGGPDRSRGVNESPTAEIARLVDATGTKIWVWGFRGILAVSTALLIAASVAAPGNAVGFWHKVAAWMAWVPFASPFGCYYYLLFSAPAWFALGPMAGTTPKTLPSRFRFLPIPLVAVTAKYVSAANAVVVSATFFAILRVLWRHKPAHSQESLPQRRPDS